MPFGETHDLNRCTQLTANQAQVIGADSLVTVVVAGDVDGFIVCNGNADAQFFALLQPYYKPITIN